jgi:hypothetical protein
MHKSQEGANVNACYEFGDDPMQMPFEHKTKMRAEY